LINLDGIDDGWSLIIHMNALPLNSMCTMS